MKNNLFVSYFSSKKKSLKGVGVEIVKNIISTNLKEIKLLLSLEFVLLK
jgi:hypothetical protein